MRNKICRVSCAGMLVLLGAPAGARFRQPQPAPVDRLARNVSAYIQEHPKDASGYYTLGRIHYLAFALKSSRVRVWQEGAEDGSKLPNIPRWGERATGVLDEDVETSLPSVQLKDHMRLAIMNFERAVELDPKNGLYYLGLACALEDGASLAGKDKARWIERAIASYFKAYTLSVKADLNIKHRPIMGLNSIASHEAGTSYVRLVENRGPTEVERAEVQGVRKNLKKLHDKPSGPITPLIFPIEGAGSLENLLAPESAVRFDLDGTGRGAWWPWVGPETGILVWDPDRTGKIVSGRQLFGSVTFWIFWPDGYRVLDALDDDRDGRLSGLELEGLAVWRDLDGNGQSDPGEVTPAWQAGIDSVRVRPSREPDGRLWAPEGLRLQGGQILPTYDWTPTPLEAPAAHAVAVRERRRTEPSATGVLQGKNTAGETPNLFASWHVGKTSPVAGAAGDEMKHNGNSRQSTGPAMAGNRPPVAASRWYSTITRPPRGLAGGGPCPPRQPLPRAP